MRLRGTPRARATVAALGTGAVLAVLGACGPPAAAPAIRDILFIHAGDDSAATLRIWRMAPDGSGARPLLSEGAAPGHANLPDWSPDGTRVAFVVQDGSATLSLFIADGDGSNVTRLAPTDFAFHEWPAWSPDGTRILFNAGPSPLEQSLHVMNADGSGLQRLTEASGRDYCGRWSPDGTSIVFTAMRADTVRLMLLDVESGTTRPALPDGFEAECADWSPDGTRLAFSSSPDHDFPPLAQAMTGSPMQSLYVLDLATGAVEALTDLPGASARPRWSRDGRRIVFHSTAPVGTVPAMDPRFRTGMEIYVVDADGSNLERLTLDDVFDGHPVW